MLWSVGCTLVERNRKRLCGKTTENHYVGQRCIRNNGHWKESAKTRHTSHTALSRNKMVHMRTNGESRFCFPPHSNSEQNRIPKTSFLFDEIHFNSPLNTNYSSLFCEVKGAGKMHLEREFRWLGQQEWRQMTVTGGCCVENTALTPGSPWGWAGTQQHRTQRTRIDSAFAPYLVTSKNWSMQRFWKKRF